MLPDSPIIGSSHHELAARLKNDDKEAFNSIYWAFHSAIYFNILRLVKDSSATEDLVQEVFIALWEKRYQLDTLQSLPGWLFTVSYNKSINYLRRKHKLILTGFSALVPEMEIAEFNYKEEQAQALAKAIELLSPQKKRVFELCKLQRKTYEEAAVELNISKHTVKEYLSGAMVSVTEYVKTHAEPTAVFSLLIFLQNSF